MSNAGQPLMSIIIPIYNVGKYLYQAVDSVLGQSFKDYELILVDDGSTDGSSDICDQYATNDNRVRVIHKENGGLSDARNKGILAADGKYLLFIDADDFIGKDSLEKLVDTLKNDGETDVILLNAVHYYNNGTIKRFSGYFNKDLIYRKNHMEALTFLTSMSDFATSACLKLIKRELLLSRDIFFRDVLWCEDTDFSMKLYLSAKTYNYCDSYIYYYRKERNGSATFSFSEKKYADLLYIISKWTNEAMVNPDYNQFSDVIYSFFAFQYCLLLSGFNKINRSAQKRLKIETKKYAWLLKKTKNRRVLLVRLFYSFFGLGFTSMALVHYEKLKSTMSKYNIKKER